jgi:hypothetical protein
MTIIVTKPELNIRDELSRLDKPSGIAGEALLRANTPQEQFNLIGAGRKNLLINSGFTVNQRGEDVTNGVTIYNVNNYFTVDRWNEYNNSGVTRKVTVNNVLLPNGTRCNSYKSEHISGTATWLHPVQKLEFENWMYGQTFTVSAWVKTSIKGFKLRLCDTVTCYLIGPEIPNDGQWHYVTGSVTLPTSGLTVGNAMQFQPAFGTAPSNLVAGDYIEFALMQVELGHTATPFEYRSYGEELALCQRYYQQDNISDSNVGPWFTVIDGLGGPYYRCTIFLPTPMRISPTVTWTYSGGGSIGANYGTQFIQNNAFTPYTNSGSGAIHISGWTATAEL